MGALTNNKPFKTEQVYTDLSVIVNSFDNKKKENSIEINLRLRVLTQND